MLRSMGPPVNARWSAHAQVAHAPGPRVDRSTPRWIGKAPVQVHLPTWSHVASSPRRGERWMFRGRLREAQHGPRWRAPVLRVASVEHGVRLRGVESFADHCLQLSDRAFSGLGRRARRAIEFGSPERVRGLFLALVLADKSALPRPMTEDFVRSGTAHLLAISGLHVVSATVALTSLARVTLPWVLTLFGTYGLSSAAALLRSGNWRPMTSLLGVVGAALYVAVAGGPVSGLRALLMVALVALAQGLERRPSGWNALAGAVIVLVWAGPTVLHQVGFQLSVISVVGLLTVGRMRVSERRKSWTRSWFDGAVTCALASAAATIATAPLCALVWGRVSLAGLWVNLLAVPLLGTLCVPILLTGAAVGLIHPSWGAPILQLAALPASGALTWIHWWSRPEICPVLVGGVAHEVVVGLYLLLGAMALGLTWAPIPRQRP